MQLGEKLWLAKNLRIWNKKEIKRDIVDGKDANEAYLLQCLLRLDDKWD